MWIVCYLFSRLGCTLVLSGRCEGDGSGVLKVGSVAGEQTYPMERWSLGLVADAGIFVDNNIAYVVTAGRQDQGEWG